MKTARAVIPDSRTILPCLVAIFHTAEVEVSERRWLGNPVDAVEVF